MFIVYFTECGNPMDPDFVAQEDHFEVETEEEAIAAVAQHKEWGYRDVGYESV